MNMNEIKITISHKDFATESDDFLRGFEKGVQAALDAVAASALDALPCVTKEQGLAMRTGQALPTAFTPADGKTP